MMYVSTRESDGGRDATRATLDQALLRGIAPDGGLYLPSALPQFAPEDFVDVSDIRMTARTFLLPFFEGSPLVDELEQIVAETFRFPLPVTRLATTHGYAAMLELYHGPTAAFKDVGAGFLAACMTRLESNSAQPLTILVATSGDTGGAVAAAFNGRAGMRVVVLYPDGMVSARQERQLTCWGDNVLSLAVQGTFDSCQAIVKEAMSDTALSDQHRFSSANSINIGRLLPQCIYYAHASSAHFKRTGKAPGFIVPTGNLGNAFACFLAKKAGLPIGDIILATNLNRTIVDYLADGKWSPRGSIQTLASAMDVGKPSNLERLRSMGGEFDVLRAQVRAVSVSDEQISAQISADNTELDLISCPHTATATHVWHELPQGAKTEQDWILVATAHAAKFEKIVEPIIGREIPLPVELAKILDIPGSCVKIDATIQAFQTAVNERFAA